MNVRTSELMCEQNEVKLMLHCRVAEQQEMNQMSAANLGIVFGPTLLRPRFVFVGFCLDQNKHHMLAFETGEGGLMMSRASCVVI